MLDKSLRHRAAAVIGVTAYTVLVCWVYVNLLSPVWSYLGYVVYGKPMLYKGFVMALALTPSLWVPLQLRRPSQIIYWFLYLLVYIPAMMVPLYALRMETVQLAQLHIAVFVAFVGLYLFTLLPVARLPRLRLSWAQYGVTVGAIGLGLAGYIVSVFGFELRLLSFLDVYTVREEYKETVAVAAGLTGYAVAWLGNAVNPLLMALGLVYKRYLVFAAGLFGQAFIYSITGYKSIALSVALFIAILIVTRREGQQLGILMAWGATGMVAIASALGMVTGINLITYLTVGRLIITPGMLTGYYFDFFSNHPKVTMSDGVLSTISRYPYEMAPDRVIGSVYKGDPDVHANANIWADAFANFGFTGILLFTCFLGIVMWLLDSVAYGRNWRVATLMVGVPAITLSNTALETSLLTHGIALVLILLYLMPRDER